MKQPHHRHIGQDDPQTITKAVTHIRLEAANAGKLAALANRSTVMTAPVGTSLAYARSRRWGIVPHCRRR